MRVLIVENSPAVRTRLVSRLHEAGLEVVGEAGTSAAALSLARSLVPDAIVLDVQLPDRRGFDILPALKVDAPGAILLILTNEPAYRRHCLTLGADFFLDKSTDFDAVAATLARAGAAARK